MRYNRISHPTQAYEGNLNVDRNLNLRKCSYIFNRTMEIGGVLSKGEKKMKSTSKTKRKILEQSVVCTESLIPYINLVCLHKPVCIKFSHFLNRWPPDYP